MKGTWTLGVVVVGATLGACAPAIRLQMHAQCRLRTGPYHFDPMPVPEGPPARERSGPTPLAVRSLDAQRVEVVVATTCRVTARLQSSSGSPWRPARRYQVESSQRCTLDLPGEGAQSVTVNGPTPPRDRHILDGPPDPEPSWVAVDYNNDVELLLRGRTPGGAYDMSCSYLVPR